MFVTGSRRDPLPDRMRHPEALLADRLVSDFASRGKPKEDYELVFEGCLGLVKLTALTMKSSKRLPFSLDDLVSAGSLGLALGLGRYQHVDGAPPSSYLGIKIRGAILDWIQAENPVPTAAYGRGQRNVSLDAISDLHSPNDLEATVLRKRMLDWAICNPALSGREKEILLYEAHAGLDLQEIGDVLGLSKSRVCIIRKEAIGKLRAIIGAERL